MRPSRRQISFTGLLIFMAFHLAACSGAVQKTSRTPEDMLAEGRYEAAREAAQSGAESTPLDRAIVAMSHLAQNPGNDGAKLALEALSRDSSDVASEVAAAEMLRLVHVVPPSANADFEVLAAQVALGAVGVGRMATTSRSASVGTEASRILAVAVLEQLSLWAALDNRAPDSERLLEVWNGAFTLLGGGFSVSSSGLAWRMYMSVASLAVLGDQIAPGSDLSKVLLRSAVSVVEENESISIAVRCDLASPFDQLRSALARDRDLLGRLERSVATATGCSRGKYAPTDK